MAFEIEATENTGMQRDYCCETSSALSVSAAVKNIALAIREDTNCGERNETTENTGMQRDYCCGTSSAPSVSAAVKKYYTI